jgi:hypothetical protein
MRFSVTLALAFAGAALAAFLSFLVLSWTLGTNVPLLPHHPNSKSLNASDIYDLTRSAVAVAALGGGVFAAVYAYRKQRVEEAASKRTDEEHLSSQYQDAADQLGSDKAAVRLAGVYAMSRLADDWIEQRQTCINVLCAYFRMHKEGDQLASGEREVRSTILDLLFEHLHPSRPSTWRGYDYNLKGSFIDLDIYILDGPGEGFIDFSESVFSSCGLTVVNPHGQSINILSFEGTQFKLDTKVKLKGHFSDGDISFNKAHLISGKLDLTSLYMSGGTLRFAETKFEGADVYFSGAHFDTGHLDFTRADFTAGRIDFNHAEFGSNVATFGYAIYGSAEIAMQDVQGDKPQGLPKEKWHPKESKVKD